MKLEGELEETYRKELDARQEIIKAEMAQGDLYTKRARPTIVYAGMLFIFLVYVLVPVIAYISGASEMPKTIDFQPCAEVARKIVELDLYRGLPKDTLLSVNVPYFV